MIVFGGETIKCGELHSTLVKQRGALVVSRKVFWGVNGVSEIISPGVNTEMIVSDMWLNDPTFTDVNVLVAYLERLDCLRGSHGQLSQLGTIPRTFENCTLEGLEYTTLDGQLSPEPIPQTCTVGPGCVPGWVQAVRLHWTTLRFIDHCEQLLS